MNRAQPPTEPLFLFEADRLQDVDDSATSGFAVSVPCLGVGNGQASLWPRFRVRTNPHGHPLSLTCDLRAWCITVHGPEHDVTLPMECHEQPAARKAAETFLAHLHQDYVAPDDPDALRDWCRWWIHHVDPYARLAQGKGT